VKSTKATGTGNTKEVVCHLVRCMCPQRTRIKQCLRKEDVLYCGVIHFSYIRYCTFRSTSQYCFLVLYVSSFPRDGFFAVLLKRLPRTLEVLKNSVFRYSVPGNYARKHQPIFLKIRYENCSFLSLLFQCHFSLGGSLFLPESLTNTV